MKTVNLLLAAAATAPYLALTACADGAPATLPEEPDDNAIRFTATAENSREAEKSTPSLARQYSTRE